MRDYRQDTDDESTANISRIGLERCNTILRWLCMLHAVRVQAWLRVLASIRTWRKSQDAQSTCNSPEDASMRCSPHVRKT